jgi:hypothetical protein
LCSNNSSCHAGGANSGGLDLGTQASAYANLVGVKSVTAKGDTTMCPGDRVVAGNASMSLLYAKVSEAVPPCGAEMPLGGPYLGKADLTLIETWINDGAKND